MRPPKYKLPYNFDEIVKFFHNKAITNTEASKILNMIWGTFLKYSKTTMN